MISHCIWKVQEKSLHLLQLVKQKLQVEGTKVTSQSAAFQMLGTKVCISFKYIVHCFKIFIFVKLVEKFKGLLLKRPINFFCKTD